MSNTDPLNTLKADAGKAAADVAAVEAKAVALHTRVAAWIGANPGKIATGVMIAVALAVWKFI